MGGRIGLLDLDLYGPSLPVLLNPIDTRIRSSPLGKGMVYPILHEGVKVLSFGYVNKMVSTILFRLLLDPLPGTQVFFKPKITK